MWSRLYDATIGARLEGDDRGRRRRWMAVQDEREQWRWDTGCELYDKEAGLLSLRELSLLLCLCKAVQGGSAARGVLEEGEKERTKRVTAAEIVRAKTRVNGRKARTRERGRGRERETEVESMGVTAMVRGTRERKWLESE